MEKIERKPGYFARLKRRKQLKQLEKTVNDQTPSIISCPDMTNGTDQNNMTEPHRISEKPPGCSNGGSKSNESKWEKRRPPGTVEFIVGPNDSLNSIALKFNITPNKLVQLNKLFSRSVYPGQKLFVPDLSQSDQNSSNGLTENSQDGLTDCRTVKSIQRELSPNSEDDSPATVKFIKMSCKYFTDGMGVVGGVLIVTPNNIMFDPHKSDPLVIEHGCEEYGLICPMEEVVSVALYNDVSRMRLKDVLPSDRPEDLCPVYRPGEWEQLPSERDLNPFSRYEAQNPKRPIVLDDIDSTLSETVCTIGDQTEKTPSDEGFTELDPTVNGSIEDGEGTSITLNTGKDQIEPRGQITTTAQDKPVHCGTKGKLDEEEDEGVAQNSSVEDGSVQSLSETLKKAATSQSEQVTEAKNAKSVDHEKLDSVKEVEENMTDQKTVTTEGELSNPQEISLNSKRTEEVAGRPAEGNELSEEEKRKKNYEAEVKSWLLQRMQAPIEGMLLSSEEKSKNPPMFLCFKVGKPMRKSFTSGLTSSPAHTSGGWGRQPEYWFAVPQERVDHLYSFFVQWSDVYGKEAREQGFVLVEKDELDMIDNFFGDPASCSWEIITINEAKRRQSFGSCDADSVDVLPLLTDSSDLLEDTHIEKLACRLPARVQGYPWRLAYSTVKHGTSLKTLYRSLLDVDSPVLLVIKDMDHQIFGAFSTHPFRVTESFYGTGETFLYSFCPEIKVYRWTGENSYFVKGNIDSLQMGGGSGQLGLWLDAELYRGTTTKCATFNNPPLSAQQDFNIHSLEVWTFE
ncbi:nuclear receptor coactivator 7 [Periophthalmus magnuspinnatus]|uniref:nuclear receptor coactivator 7 n=1 Tax=Periophthalmus magnuspinnatus TaxID=409849 RepID=UPI00145AAB03|nr:nuclear receptor coactivator 7 [Periophthalmus magnuspinnatus]